MLRSARVPAFAKINLTLAVLWKRPTGFHDIATVFQTIDLCDWLEISVEDGDGVFVSSNIEIPGKNIAETAAERVLAALGRRARVNIHIEKHIPLGGGLGGSSTDGSAVLLALPRLLDCSVGFDFLDPIASSLGSDVNFLMRGGTAAAFGRGDETWELADGTSFYGKLFAPGFPVTAGEAYRALGRPEVNSFSQEAQVEARRRFEELLGGFGRMPLGAWGARCRNDFEDFVFSKYPELGRRREEMALGADLARMSGSGSSLFALFEREVPGVDFRSLSRVGFESAWARAGLGGPPARLDA